MFNRMWETLLLASVVAVYAWPTFAKEPAESSTPVFWAAHRPETSEQIGEALSKPLHSLGLEFQGAPLSQVVGFLRDEYDIEVQLDMTALDDLGISPDDPIDVNLRNISLGSALRIMLKQLDLTTIVSDEVLLITSEEAALTRLTVAVYPVGDLLAAKHRNDANANDDTEAKPEDIDALISIIIGCVASDTWVDNGGPEAEIHAIQPGLLVVSQTQDVHKAIAQLLKAMRLAKAHPFAVPHRNDPHGSGGTFCGRHHPTNQPTPAEGATPTEAPRGESGVQRVWQPGYGWVDPRGGGVF